MLIVRFTKPLKKRMTSTKVKFLIKKVNIRNISPLKGLRDSKTTNKNDDNSVVSKKFEYKRKKKKKHKREDKPCPLIRGML